jgi:hypothetical protein
MGTDVSMLAQSSNSTHLVAHVSMNYRVGNVARPTTADIIGGPRHTIEINNVASFHMIE